MTSPCSLSLASISFSRGGQADYEIMTPFAPIFRRWNLGIGYQGTTIEVLARRQFQQNLTLTLLALVLLNGGVLLTLRAITRERKLLEAKATFVSNVSHELKTPLSLIRLFAETLELGHVKDTGEMRDYGRIIHRESSRLTQLINNILDFSKIESGQRIYQFERANLAQLIEETLKLFVVRLEQDGFRIFFERPAYPLSDALLDTEAIAQAFINLLDNAVKYSGNRRTVTVRVDQALNFVTVAVADGGIGIEADELEKIFEKFYRVSTGLVHDVKGSGLGLSIVKHVVEAHRGKVTVESSPGDGSIFTIFLPKAPPLGAETLSPTGHHADESAFGGEGLRA